MSARSTFIYDSDSRLREVVDMMSEEMAGIVESTYSADSMAAIPQIPQALRDTFKFYLKHGICVLVKHEDSESGETHFSQLHPDADDMKIHLQPTPRLTIARYVPRIRREESIVLGEDKFRVFKGGVTDIDFADLLTFLGYTFSTPADPAT